MKIPEIKDLLDAGVHFGHQTLRWNPKMKKYILAARNGIHIVDLARTQECLKVAMEKAQEVNRSGKKILFVGTKKSISPSIMEEAKRVGMYYVTNRWLGGMLTNFQTVRQSIKKLEDIEKMEADGLFKEMKKKEIGTLRKQKAKLDAFLGGIRDMKYLPGLVFVADTRHEHIAVREARRLGIPVIGIVDTNASPDEVTHPIPGNDDAIKSVSLLTRAIVDAILDLPEFTPAAPSAPVAEAVEA